MSQVTTAANWAPYISVSLFRRLFSIVRTSWIMLVVDNPLSWRWGFRGRKSVNDDIEGPYYVPGAPTRQIEDGKAVLAPAELLRKQGPFLLILDVKDTKGDPIPNAVLDGWQADSEGVYHFASWTLRGKVTADAYGRAEILTVRPGDYGAPLLGKRAGHLHLMVTGVQGKHAPLTTQVYVCPANDTEHLRIDFADTWRPTRRQNMATGWSIPAANGGERLHNLPELPADDVETTKCLKWWNERLREHGIERNVVAGGRHEMILATV